MLGVRAIQEAFAPGHHLCAGTGADVGALHGTRCEPVLGNHIYDNMEDLSRVCVSALRAVYKWQVSVLSASVLTAIEDGMGQAKFRLPRVLVRSHAFLGGCTDPPCMSRASGRTVHATSERSPTVTS